jgi:hypothetical protein
MNWLRDSQPGSERHGALFSVLALFPKSNACFFGSAGPSAAWESIFRAKYWYLRLYKHWRRNAQSKKQRQKKHRRQSIAAYKHAPSGRASGEAAIAYSLFVDKPNGN